MDEDLNKLLGDIPALTEFLSEPPSLAERIRELLMRTSGDAFWQRGGIIPFAGPAGAGFYVIIAPSPGGAREIQAVVSQGDDLFVAEALQPEEGMLLDGSILSIPLEEKDGSALRGKCLQQILSALLECHQMVKCAAISRSKRKRLLEQLVHACQHLVEGYLDLELKKEDGED